MLRNSTIKVGLELGSVGPPQGKIVRSGVVKRCQREWFGEVFGLLRFDFGIWVTLITRGIIDALLRYTMLSKYLEGSNFFFGGGGGTTGNDDVLMRL